MIEEFSFGNFRSFKDIQTLNMSAAKIKSKYPSMDANNIINVNEELSLLKSKAIYGANAGGKSNVIMALLAFIRIIYFSLRDENILKYIEPFRLSTETTEQPTFFQLIFRIGKTRYRYGFEADAKSIKSEWLFSTPNKREQPLFIREKNEIIEVNKVHFEEGNTLMSLMGDKNDGQIFRSNSLYLSSLASFGFAKISNLIVKTITSSIDIIPGLGHPGMSKYAGESLDNIQVKNFMLNFLNKADIDINDVETEIISKDPQHEIGELDHSKFEISKIIISKRTKYNKSLKKDGEVKFNFGEFESEGTKKMFELSPYIYRALNEGTTLIIDEFDARFHPLLTKKIIELFHSKENSKSQLIFITHDTNLLSSSLLRRDQIDFVEKDKYGASHLYTLVELKGVRNDASFEKDYIQGKYGAIPFVGDFSNLMSVE